MTTNNVPICPSCTLTHGGWQINHSYNVKHGIEITAVAQIFLLLLKWHARCYVNRNKYFSSRLLKGNILWFMERKNLLRTVH